MAAITLGLANFLTGALESYTSGLFTPAGDDRLVVWVSTPSSRVDGQLLSSVAGQSFQKLGHVDFGGSSRAYLFVSKHPATAVAQQVTFLCTGDPANSGGFLVYRASGMLRTGLDMVRQFAFDSGPTLTTPQMFFPVDALTENAIAAGFTHTSVNAIAQPIGYTELADTQGATSNRRIEGAALNSGLTVTGVTYGGESASDFAAFSLELDTSAPDAGYENLTDVGVSGIGGLDTTARYEGITQVDQ